MKKIQILLIVLYVLCTVIFGTLTAEQDFVSKFVGLQKLLWYGLLLVYYGGIMIFTTWIMIFLTAIFTKLANRQCFDKKRTETFTIWILIPIFYTHILCLFLFKYVTSSSLVFLLFLIPLFIAYLLTNQLKDLKGVKKGIALIPILIYVAFDIFTIYLT